MVPRRLARIVLACACVVGGCFARNPNVRHSDDQAGSAASGGAGGAGGMLGDCQRDPSGSTAHTPDGTSVTLEGCPSLLGGPGLGGQGAGGASAGGAFGTGLCPTTDTPPADAAALRVYHLVEGELRARIQRAIGRYACGATPVYRGTFSAHDAFSMTDLEGAVLASIESTTRDLNVACAFESQVAGKELVLTQATSSTSSLSFFQPFAHQTTTYAIWTNSLPVCDGCMDNFTNVAPPQLDVANATLSPPACPNPTRGPTVVASGHLTLVSAPSIDDIVQVYRAEGNDPLPALSRQGTEMVATIDGELIEMAPQTCGLACRSVTPYHVDWYVDRADATRYGLRNFRIDPAALQCCASYFDPA
jgi:hypothetical protein